MDNEIFIIDSKIQAIKLVRSFTGLGLKESKIVVENWMAAFHYFTEVHCNSFEEINALGRLAYAVKKGEWTITVDDKILINRPITSEDIRNL